MTTKQSETISLFRNNTNFIIDNTDKRGCIYMCRKDDFRDRIKIDVDGRWEVVKNELEAESNAGK